MTDTTYIWASSEPTGAELALTSLVNAGSATLLWTDAALLMVPGGDASGSIATELFGISQVAQGHMNAQGTITTQLGGISQSAQGYLNADGTITTALSGISQEIVGADIVAEARITQAYAEMLRTDANAPTWARVTQSFAEMLRTDADYMPPPSVRETQVYAEVLIREFVFAHSAKKRRVITAMSGV